MNLSAKTDDKLDILNEKESLSSEGIETGGGGNYCHHYFLRSFLSLKFITGMSIKLSLQLSLSGGNGSIVEGRRGYT